MKLSTFIVEEFDNRLFGGHWHICYTFSLISLVYIEDLVLKSAVSFLCKKIKMKVCYGNSGEMEKLNE